jgi:streptogramin lyase
MLLALLSLSSALAATFRIETITGTGKAGFSGDGGAAKVAEINNPYGLTIGPGGALYFCDMSNHRIRRIDTNGVITTVAGNGEKGWSGDDGLATKATLNEPYEIRFDRSGSMFFVEMRNHVIRRVDGRSQTISTVAGGGKAGFIDNQPGPKALFNQPHSIQFIGEGALWICDIGNHRVRSLNLETALVTTVGGTGEKSSTREREPLLNNSLHGPRAIDIAADGTIWLALREGNAIYSAAPSTRILKREVGSGAQGFTGNDGPALHATLSGPKGIAAAKNGWIIWADTESHSIRYLDPKTKLVHVLAGTGKRGDGADGNALKCELNRPHGVFADANGNLWIGDSENHRIRRVKIH